MANDPRTDDPDFAIVDAAMRSLAAAPVPPAPRGAAEIAWRRAGIVRDFNARRRGARAADLVLPGVIACEAIAGAMLAGAFLRAPEGGVAAAAVASLALFALLAAAAALLAADAARPQGSLAP